MKEGFWKKEEKKIIFRGEKLNVFESCVSRHSLENPNKPAFIFEDKSGKKEIYSYERLNRETGKFANLLNNLKIKKNSRIFLFLPKIPLLYIGFLGIIRQGSISIPIFEAFEKDGLELRLVRGNANVILTNKELFKRIPKDIKKKIPALKKILIIDSEEFKSKMKKVSEDFKLVLRKKEDVCFMIFTSSTAGTPIAGVEIPNYGIVQQDFTARFSLGLKKDSNYWCTAHPGWVTGSVYSILAPLSIGCTIFIYTEHFDSKRWIKFILKNKISVIYTAPTALRLLKHDIKKKDLANLKNLSSVGEALTETTFNFYKKLGIKINDTYWQSETGAIVIGNNPNLKKKAGSLGKPIPGITAKIKKDMILLKKGWPSMMVGIYKHKKMYENYFEGSWFKTNDLAKKDKEGYFFFKARKDDIIKTSGERVSPIEIESALMKNKEVKEVAVIGVPDKIKGQIIKAFVVLRNPEKFLGDNKKSKREKLKESLENYVKENYAGHSYPKIIKFLSKLPKTNSGKIIRMKLREKN